VAEAAEEVDFFRQRFLLPHWEQLKQLLLVLEEMVEQALLPQRTLQALMDLLVQILFLAYFAQLADLMGEAAQLALLERDCNYQTLAEPQQLLELAGLRVFQAQLRQHLLLAALEVGQEQA
jgi:hypothetical protein